MQQFPLVCLYKIKPLPSWKSLFSICSQRPAEKTCYPWLGKDLFFRAHPLFPKRSHGLDFPVISWAMNKHWMCFPGMSWLFRGWTHCMFLKNRTAASLKVTSSWSLGCESLRIAQGALYSKSQASHAGTRTRACPPPHTRKSWRTNQAVLEHARRPIRQALTTSHRTSSQIATEGREVLTRAALRMLPHASAWGHPYEGTSLVPLGCCDLGKLSGGVWVGEREGSKEKRKLPGKKRQDQESSRSQGITEVLRVRIAERTALGQLHRPMPAWGGGTAGEQWGCVLGRGSDTVPTLPSDGRTATANKVSVIAWGSPWGCWQHKPKLRWLWSPQVGHLGSSGMTLKGWVAAARILRP